MRSFRALRLLQELSYGMPAAGSGTTVSHGLAFREVCRVRPSGLPTVDSYPSLS